MAEGGGGHQMLMDAHVREGGVSEMLTWAFWKSLILIWRTLSHTDQHRCIEFEASGANARSFRHLLLQMYGENSKFSNLRAAETLLKIYWCICTTWPSLTLMLQTMSVAKFHGKAIYLHLTNCTMMKTTRFCKIWAEFQYEKKHTSMLKPLISNKV